MKNQSLKPTFNQHIAFELFFYYWESINKEEDKRKSRNMSSGLSLVVFNLCLIYLLKFATIKILRQRKCLGPDNFVTVVVNSIPQFVIFNSWKVLWNCETLKILLLYHLVCYITWLDVTLDNLQTKPLRQILLFLIA